MKDDPIKQHWENIYSTKQSNEVSWSQEIPSTSLEFIYSLHLPKSASIIDIGGGDSKLVDFLLEDGFENITVLDISSQALKKVQSRLGDKAKKVKWLVSDITQYHPETTYDLWHDRAAFHFLTTIDQINSYLATAREAVTGYLTIGTFSDKGPDRCSELAVKKYTEEQLTEELSIGFKKIRCITEDHATPFNTKQNFLFCSFLKIHDS